MKADNEVDYESFLCFPLVRYENLDAKIISSFLLVTVACIKTNAD